METNLLVSLLDQLLITVGYSAARFVLAMVDKRLLFGGYLGVAVGVGLIALLGSMLRANKPLQTALVVMASKYVTSSLPLLEEPAGMLVVPAVLLYYLSCAAFVWLSHHFCLGKSHCPPGEQSFYMQDFAVRLEPFIIAFAAVRGIRHFEETRQGYLMLYMAFCYIILCPAPAHNHQSSDWGACVTRLLDSFACRGLISAFNNFGPVGTAVAGLQTATIYVLVLLVMHMFRLSALVHRVRFCQDTFCLSIAQEFIAFIQSKTSSSAAVAPVFYIFAASTVLLLYPSCVVAYDSMCTIVLGGLSIAAAKLVDAYLLQAQGSPLEALLLYGALFVALQLGIDLKRPVAARVVSQKKKEREIIVISASIDSYADADYLA